MMHRNGAVQYLPALVMSGAMLLGGELFVPAALAQQGSASVQTLEGVISDGMCGVSHNGKNAAECTMACVRSGRGWVLVVSDKVYTLEGRMGGISQLAGQKAKITGKVTGNKINVTDVEVPD